MRRLIARLALAIIAADGRITTAELVSLGRLDRLGLGPLAALAREEIERAVHVPIDIGATCAALPALGEDAATLVVTALAEVAASDRPLAPRARETFTTTAAHLGLGARASARILEAAIGPAASGEPDAAPARPAGGGAPDRPLADALRVLALTTGADRSCLDTTYLDLVQRYDPARVGELGAEFAALAVRRLAAITDAYEVALASTPRLTPSSRAAGRSPTS